MNSSKYGITNFKRTKDDRVKVTMSLRAPETLTGGIPFAVPELELTTAFPAEAFSSSFGVNIPEAAILLSLRAAVLQRIKDLGINVAE